MTKEELLKEIDEYKPTHDKNIMGCSENWYNPCYAIGRVFTKEELKEMSDREINNLYKLADTLSDAFY